MYRLHGCSCDACIDCEFTDCKHLQFAGPWLSAMLSFHPLQINTAQIEFEKDIRKQLLHHTASLINVTFLLPCCWRRRPINGHRCCWSCRWQKYGPKQCKHMPFVVFIHSLMITTTQKLKCLQNIAYAQKCLQHVIRDTFVKPMENCIYSPFR